MSYYGLKHPTNVRKIVKNTKIIQPYDSYLCGVYCIFIAIKRIKFKLKLSIILNLFSRKLIDNDVKMLRYYSSLLKN